MAALEIGVTVGPKMEVKLTAFGGTILTTLPIFAIITNSYTIKLRVSLEQRQINVVVGEAISEEIIAKMACGVP